MIIGYFAISVHLVLIQKALTDVAAIAGSMEMESGVMIMMSATTMFTIATRKPRALTHTVRITAVVTKDTRDMVKSAKVSRLRRYRKNINKNM